MRQNCSSKDKTKKMLRMRGDRNFLMTARNKKDYNSKKKRKKDLDKFRSSNSLRIPRD